MTCPTTVPRRVWTQPTSASIRTPIGTRKHVTVPCCAECAATVKSGSWPPGLLLADTGGRVRPGYFDDDVWTTTGYGAIDDYDEAARLLDRRRDDRDNRKTIELCARGQERLAKVTTI